MNILALDTSSSACSVGLLCNDRIEVLHETAPLQQAKFILPMLQQVLASQALELKDLDAIAVGCGPGSFTGTRIAISVVQGIGFALNKPIITLSSMAALAQSAYLEGPIGPGSGPPCNQWMVAIDARMEQIYWALYGMGKQGCVELIGQEQVCAPKEITLPPSKNGANEEMDDTEIDDKNLHLSWCGVGDGWEKYEKVLEQQLGFKPAGIYTAQVPSARGLLQLAVSRFKRGEWAPAKEVLPVYLR